MKKKSENGYVLALFAKKYISRIHYYLKYANYFFRKEKSPFFS